MRKLKKILKKKGGRNSRGQVSVRHIGGGHKQFWRKIDFKRNKVGIPGKVVALEYDPNRTAKIALVSYADGEKRYILAPEGLEAGDEIMAGPAAEIKPGNHLPLANIPAGTQIHNLEITAGKGGQLIRSAGTAAVVLAKEGDFVNIKLPSGGIRRVKSSLQATIGKLGNAKHAALVLGKAGNKRRRGIKPTVRGTAQNPHSHPHGGGEGRSGIGMPGPKTPWGKNARGKKTRRKKKYSDKYIIKRRK